MLVNMNVHKTAIATMVKFVIKKNFAVLKFVAMKIIIMDILLQNVSADGMVVNGAVMVVPMKDRYVVMMEAFHRPVVIMTITHFLITVMNVSTISLLQKVEILNIVQLAIIVQMNAVIIIYGRMGHVMLMQQQLAWEQPHHVVILITSVVKEITKFFTPCDIRIWKGASAKRVIRLKQWQVLCRMALSQYQI